MELNKIYKGEALEILKTFPSESVDMVITSPPYWGLRDYGIEKQLGQEKTYQEYIEKLCDVFDEVNRILKSDGSCWVNIGDAYGGSGNGTTKNVDVSKYVKNSKQSYVLGNGKSISSSLRGGNLNKCLLQIPSRFAIEMVDRGWILRNEIIWHKPNAMPSSVKDRFTVDYEKIFFFTKNKKYYFEQQKEPMVTNNTPSKKTKDTKKTENLKRKQDLVGRNDYTGFNDRYIPSKDFKRNKRCVWSISTKPFKEAHFATFPEELITTPIKAGCPKGGIVLDIFMGSGTTGVVANKLDRNYIGIELNEEYINIAQQRIQTEKEKINEEKN